jgi:5-methylthioadenosine/S-adenosylhomocysteine deaminase
MLVEMKVAALLNKTRHRDPTILPAWKLLRLATIEGAYTMGLGKMIGSLEAGKLADIILLNLRVPHMTPILTRPVPNVAPNIVYSARGDEVDTVLINGEPIMEKGKVHTMDEEGIIKEAQAAAVEIAENASEDYFKTNNHLVKISANYIQLFLAPLLFSRYKEQTG